MLFGENVLKLKFATSFECVIQRKFVKIESLPGLFTDTACTILTASIQFATSFEYVIQRKIVNISKFACTTH
ncbi:hypothetical protein SPOG_05009 [Schizosaccharomyces cryophilus OY26]|uniref:Uncharacterized protein n=1 Tax=Schizosaccharomyces cryophilus (strain OY26 / ATCC MYA-4695 / CBS 11777 / NBRC 106824 / NRRL Y48691) TaxID=653667 RepID=S9X5U7_SCHCR|nr:uncharacterized protein SPOG_05009 [Schizosaccharomyces cryophilus OY26]EPY49166.1 hypothetical protein SPOG_05009 [Schizosaccharomyces cryophilus OY26]